jgi:hypothetical protein
MQKSKTLSSSSKITINDLWRRGGLNVINYNKFIGLASNGFGVYDTGVNGTDLPSYYSKAGEFKSPTVLGFGVGAGFSANLRAGVDIKLKASLGSADLALNDSIKWNWTKTGDNIMLSSVYLKRPSSLLVKGPSLNLDLAGRGDFNANAYLKSIYPFAPGWGDKNVFSSQADYTFFRQSFNSKQPQALNLFNGAALIDYSGLNLDTISNAQLAKGVRSSVQRPLLEAKLDIDNILGQVWGYPNFAVPTNLYIFGLSASASLDLLDAELGLKTSLAQNITAQVDKITGLLKLEDGSFINYKVGDSITLPLSKYDKNKNGKLGISFKYKKQGTLENKTDLLVEVDSSVKLFSGTVAGKADLGLVGTYDKSYSFGPLASASWPITSNTYNLFDKSWAANLGTGSSQLVLA